MGCGGTPEDELSSSESHWLMVMLVVRLVCFRLKRFRYLWKGGVGLRDVSGGCGLVITCRSVICVVVGESYRCL